MENDNILIEKDDEFKYPNNIKKISIEQAFNYFWDSINHKRYAFRDNIEFYETLILICNVDPNYILSDEFITKISYANLKDSFDDVLNETKNHIIEHNFTQKEVEKIIYDFRHKNIRNKAINNATERYNKLKGLKKLRVDLKRQNPSNKDFDSMTVEEINEMYTKGKKK